MLSELPSKTKTAGCVAKELLINYVFPQNINYVTEIICTWEIVDDINYIGSNSFLRTIFVG